MKVRTPPHDLSAEQSVLGALMLDQEAIIKVSERLSPESFYLPAHRVIYEAMSTLFEERSPIDVVTVTNQLKKQKKLTEAGGAAAIADLSNAVSSAANVVQYAKLVAEAALRRNMITAAARMTEMAFDESTKTPDVLETAEQHVFSLSQKQASRAFVSLKDTLAESFERLDELQRSGNDLRGLPTGFNDLDNILAGLQKSNLIILAARPGMGKTALALNIASHISVSDKKKVGFFSLEMSKEELVDRLLVAQADIDAWRLKTGRLDQQDFLKLSDGMGVLAEAELFIDDTPGMSISEMRTKARRLMMEHQIDFIIVDYLQLAHGRTKDNRVQEVAEISQGLKNVARELRVPVLALSQLSRAVESRGEKIPQLSDLRESGCVTGDTLVTLADSGREVPIADLVGKQGFRVWSVDQEANKIVAATVSKVFSTGRKQVYELQTALGRKIRATANHQFLTVGGWKRLDELSEQDHLALPRLLADPQTKQKQLQTMTNQELALLGHLIGDGCTLPRHVIQYTSKDKDLADLVAGLATEVFGPEVAPRVSAERSWYQVYLTSLRHHSPNHGSAISDWLKKLKVWGLRSYEKKIPDEVFSQPSAAVAIFLRHLWSTDGCVKLVTHQSRKTIPAVYYATSSGQLAKQVQSLLLRVNIRSRLKCVPQFGKGRDQYHVIISSKPDLEQFIAQVGAVGESKLKPLAEIATHLSKLETNPNRDVLPRSLWPTLIKPEMKRLGFSQRAVCDLLGLSRSGAMFSQNLSRAKMAKLAAAIGSKELKKWSESDIYWDKISSITKLSVEEVYDLTVPAHANFVANNMIIHNSIEQDADVVMFLYRKDDDNREAMNVKIAKHRNGPIGEIDLYFRGERLKFYGLESKRND